MTLEEENVLLKLEIEKLVKELDEKNIIGFLI